MTEYYKIHIEPLVHILKISKHYVTWFSVKLNFNQHILKVPPDCNKQNTIKKCWARVSPGTQEPHPSTLQRKNQNQRLQIDEVSS